MSSERAVVCEAAGLAAAQTSTVTPIAIDALIAASDPQCGEVRAPVPRCPSSSGDEDRAGSPPARIDGPPDAAPPRRPAARASPDRGARQPSRRTVPRSDPVWDRGTPDRRHAAPLPPGARAPPQPGPTTSRPDEPRAVSRDPSAIADP